MDSAMRIMRALRLNQQMAENLRENPNQWQYGGRAAVIIPANNGANAPMKAQSERVVIESDDLLSYAPEEKSLPGLYIGAKPLDPETNDYFEVEIVDCGLSGDIAIGLVSRNHPLDQPPGLVSGSLGYHSGDGKIYFGHQRGTSVASKCDVGDRIGCGIRIDNSQSSHSSASSRMKLGGNERVNMLRLLPYLKLRVFFTINGNEIASSVITPLLFRGGLYPAIALSSPGEEVKLNLNSHWVPPPIPQSLSDDSLMCVDSYEDDWMRLSDVRCSGNMLEYTGRGKSILDVGLAQARRPLDTRYHYFEIEIVDPGLKCYIAIGLTKKDYPSRSHPGWSKGSIAYHADDGKLFIGTGAGDPFGPKCNRGDIMGCGIIFPSDYNPSVTGHRSSRKDSSDESDCLQPSSSSDEKTHSELSQSDYESDASDGLYDENDDDFDDQYLLDIDRIPMNVINDRMYRKYVAKNEVRYDLSTKVNVYFTRNGKTIGSSEIYIPEGGFYPTVGMLSIAEKVKVDLNPLTG
ncbi:SPRY domain-containing protein 3-like isoform X2 [Dinothrombium tinctorium]|uniref:SPRY domain-containing protein 3-like isoform X2 n=2 Tax=Dinothrombium tinctorium TaxID=1965070 RepID=A0A3S3S4L8_9ACAR|nr:SPRY domain-containing protein 3-like isoform X2 [Dinothrombium tinctorium]RWS10298.1 SPRY domain-containing protein 3-like isoform X2 [Dinothrombium tinctorium]